MITFIAIIFLSIIGINQPVIPVQETNHTIHVKIDNVSSNMGNVSFALYTKEGFLKETKLSELSTISEYKSEVVFENVPEGVYSVVCYHDENNNKKLDFAENGMPMEDYGSSNTIFNYGLPDFESSKVNLKEEKLVLEIRF